MRNTESNTKYFTAILAVTLMLLGLSQSLLAQTSDVANLTAPGNDNFANAQTLIGASNLIAGTNIGATKETGEPYHAHNAGGASVWYRYVATGTGSLTIKTATPASGTFDTVLAVYGGSSVGQLFQNAANDDFPGSGDKSSVTIGVVSGGEYLIAIDISTSGNGTLPGNFVLVWSLSNASANDNFANAELIGSDTGSLSTTNIGASKEPNEPNHANDQGGKSVWFKWTAPSDIPRSYTFDTRGTNNSTASDFFHSLAIYTGQSVGALIQVGSDTGTNTRPFVTFSPTPGADYYIAVDGLYSAGQGAREGTIILNWSPTRGTKAADFDDDGRADITLFRPTDGNWYSLDSERGNYRVAHWGKNGDKPVYSDRDQDGRNDYAIYRPDTGTWYTLRTDSNTMQALPFGTSEDIPVSANYVQLNITYPVVFRPSTGIWYVSDGSGGLAFAKQFGQNGDIPVPADYDGNGRTDFAVFRPSTGDWHILLNPNFSNPNPVTYTLHFGLNGDKPVAADYDNDGRADIAVYRPSTGTWFIKNSSDGSVRIAQWGNSSDVPQSADYDGDGHADLAVFRPSTGFWYILQSRNNAARYIPFGQNGDLPAAAAYQH